MNKNEKQVAIMTVCSPEFKEQVKKFVSENGFSTMSEFVRVTLRDRMK